MISAANPSPPDVHQLQWGDVGVGMLRLKKHKETGARRMLLRNSSTGKITIARVDSIELVPRSVSLQLATKDPQGGPESDLNAVKS
ncbi:hypothetical protein L227DRAFT_579227 [Lentinus tigrinus ALCF2SS1-6]|uniref:RanBD1 domain-containing protein n=1 Tax=Lentinus tigrinus ALCF2SS1-6 TaxID=1328759 RepID=A0A5C2RY87_9APHY|nr:hypothetical protein L227DRAFT_579227 [Lentinus tigrinus ALCF2SS1-6]